MTTTTAAAVSNDTDYRAFVSFDDDNDDIHTTYLLAFYCDLSFSAFAG